MFLCESVSLEIFEGFSFVSLQILRLFLDKKKWVAAAVLVTKTQLFLPESERLIQNICMFYFLQKKNQ